MKIPAFIRKPANPLDEQCGELCRAECDFAQRRVTADTRSQNSLVFDANIAILVLAYGPIDAIAEDEALHTEFSEALYKALITGSPAAISAVGNVAIACCRDYYMSTALHMQELAEVATRRANAEASVDAEIDACIRALKEGAA